MEGAADQSEPILYQPLPEPALRSCRNTVNRLAAGGLNGAPQSRLVALRPWLKKRTRPSVAVIYRLMLTRECGHL
jgi:hypothetical protein